MSTSIHRIYVAASCLALASCAGQPSVGVPPGKYVMTVTPTQPAPHPACLGMAGTGDLIFREGVAVTHLLSPLHLVVDGNGALTGSGIEGMTGYSGVTKLIGQRTGTGYEGTMVGTTYGVDCAARWVITRS